ncbi:bifunctional phosphopantothenoylcysteine decarboxylase/phosphopantothenate--cysteine ligase CoaBC [Selenomonas sputigena]|uniref:Coenzyme A biosynthesis bifunctional protein CoaBC n=1 Tax=Selenomonas sputigena TaxID=69823 RepID=A0ABV3X3G3_9FIRM
MVFEGKKIVLGVTGGIAAYKAVEIASRLRKKGAEVHVIMTQEATHFVAPLTFREITGQPVTTDMWTEPSHWHVAHIALAQLAEIFLIAPATANIIAKAAAGIADDMLTTTLLAVKAPIFFAPAMNSAMYENPVTQENIAKLLRLGWHKIEPAAGYLACGTAGVGRLPEPVDIVGEIEKSLSVSSSLYGMKVLVTAGGTLEAIDPVRFIGNRSSGKMGYAVAKEAARRGAEVVLVAGGTVALPDPPGMRVLHTESALAMREAVLQEAVEADIIVKAAAVADYRPKEAAGQKIKKNAEEITLVLEKNPDILMELGARKKPGQVLVGFAAETQNLMEYAQRKLTKKNLDFIVANDVTRTGAGFNTETNLVKILSRDGSVEEVPLMGKDALAALILDRVEFLQK